MAVQKSKRKTVTKAKPYETGLDRVPANYQPLTPLSFLERAARTFPRHTAIIHGRQRTDYATFYARSRRLASARAQNGIARGDTGAAKGRIADRQFSATVAAALALLKKKPLVIDYDDPEFSQSGARLGKI